MRSFRRILLGLLLVLRAFPLFAQSRPQSTTVTNTTAQHTVFETKTAAATIDFNIGNGATSHMVAYYAAQSITGITVTVFAKKDSDASYTSLATSTNLSDVVRFTGIYNQGRVTYSGITGSGAINGDYFSTVSPTASGTGSDVNITNSSIAITAASPLVVTQGTAANFNATVRMNDGSGTSITSTGGAIDVNVKSGGATGSSFGSAVPATGTAIGFSDGTNLRSARSFDLDSGAGREDVVGVSIRTSGMGGSTEVQFATDAADNAVVSSNPVPAGCVYYASPSALTDTKIGYTRCDVNRYQIIVGAGTAGSPAGQLVSVQGAASMTPILATLSGTNGVNATQTGTWTVQPGNTANTTPWLINTSDLVGPIATGKITVTTSATQVVAARSGRVAVEITVITGSDDIYCSGTNAVTTSNGDLLVGVKGASMKVFTAGAVWCRVGTTSQDVTFREEF